MYIIPICKNIGLGTCLKTPNYPKKSDGDGIKVTGCVYDSTQQYIQRILPNRGMRAHKHRELKRLNDKSSFLRRVECTLHASE